MYFKLDYILIQALSKGTLALSTDRPCLLKITGVLEIAHLKTLRCAVGVLKLTHLQKIRRMIILHFHDLKTNCFKTSRSVSA